MKENFLLKTETGKELYGYVKDLPVIDYHDHLSLDEILSDKRYSDIYELWIKPDPYKHRAMRMLGVEEKFITGESSNEEKFVKWCESLPKLVMHPLAHWSAMELALFGVEEFPNANNAKCLYKRLNDYLAQNVVTAKSLLKSFNVELACPCLSIVGDDKVFGKDKSIIPSLRLDDVLSPSSQFVEKLESSAQTEINSVETFFAAVDKRLEDFKAIGAVFCDVALDDGFVYFSDDGKNGERFKSLLSGKSGGEERKKLSSYILLKLASLFAEKGFIMQLHIGAKRDTSDRLRRIAGANGGFAGIGGTVDVRSLAGFLNEVEKGKFGLPKIVLFTLNPSDNAVMSTLSGSYVKDGERGLVTQGPAWWWCDHKDGIEEVLESVSNYGALYNFIGMTTDSRSFLSFVRHDYFRRILCQWLGQKWEQGEIFCDKSGLFDLANKMCYGSVKECLTKRRR
ncbi:MAG: glucuronate isomerase [Clostridia bacterium]|nr:glucuronate isomerase [Clostridia bacterium]